MTKAVFYRHFAGDPFFNIAVDEWLLGRVSSMPGLVCLRVYTWQPGGITFGFNQRKELALDLSKVSDTPVVRRITGGRAVYHDPGELTYSMAVNTHQMDNHRLAGPLSKTSTSIAEALTYFVGQLGVKSQYLRRSHRQDNEPGSLHSAACFDSTARYEVTANSQKIIASAQRRIGSAYLQHGSIKLRGVAPHQALAAKPSSDYSSNHIPPITENEFISMADLFSNCMGQLLGLRFEDLNMGKGDAEEIADRTAFVRKNPLSRRDIFKHWPPVNSL
jgi:lipoate-protein ligase A